MRGGVRRLLVLTAAPTRSSIVRQLNGTERIAIAAGDIELGTLSADCVAAAVDQVLAERTLPWTEDEFRDLQRAVRADAPALALRALRAAAAVIVTANGVRDRLARLHAPVLRPSVDDANAHLGRLVFPGFVSRSGIDRLDDVARYVRAIDYRLDHLAGHADRDRERIADVEPLERRYAMVVDHAGSGSLAPEIADVAWQLEELRVVTFAQPLMVKQPGRPAASAARIERALAGATGTSRQR